jgi:hypothetical protein
VQAAILNLLVELQAEKKVAYLLISHDLGVVRYLSDRIAVLYLGRVMELGPADKVFESPQHPYTEALGSAVRTVEGEEDLRIRLTGEAPKCGVPAIRVRVPYALPALHWRCLQDAGSGIQRGGAWALLALSLLRRGAQGDTEDATHGPDARGKRRGGGQLGRAGWPGALERRRREPDASGNERLSPGPVGTGTAGRGAARTRSAGADGDRLARASTLGRGARPSRRRRRLPF